jgi:hypothetical protein
MAREGPAPRAGFDVPDDRDVTESSMSRSRCLPTGILICVVSWAAASTAGADAAPPATASTAESGAETAAQDNPFADTACAAEHDRLCRHTRGWRLGFECLRKNYKAGSLAQECADWTDEINRKKREEVLARERAWKEACAKDIAAHCSEYKKNMAIKGCLYQIRDQVAPACDEKLPRRNTYQGPGFAGWRDGSEPDDFLDQRRKQLRPREAQRIENEKKRQEEHDQKRAEVRERIARNKAAAEAAKAAAAKAAAEAGYGANNEAAGASEAAVDTTAEAPDANSDR